MKAAFRGWRTKAAFRGWRTFRDATAANTASATVNFSFPSGCWPE